MNSEKLQSIIYIPSREIIRQVMESSFTWPTRSQTEAGDNVKVEPRSMVSVYYEMANDLMRVPHQHEFALEYLNANAGFLESFPEEIKKAIYYRARRAWGTFVAEHQLYGILVESGKYSCRKAVSDDVEGQADMVIEDKEGRFALDIHTGTKFSQSWRDKKQFRHDRKSDIPTLELYLLNSPYTRKVSNKEGTATIHLFLPNIVRFIEEWRKEHSVPHIFRCILLGW